MKQLMLLFTILLSIPLWGQDKFNLGLEEPSKSKSLPDGWFKWGDYTLSADTLAYSGGISGKVTSFEGGSFGCIAYRIPARYRGSNIVLRGYMKIREVDEFAGLLLRIDGNGSALAFDNMEKEQINGTRDWQEYSIRLDYPEEADWIYVAGILVGNGEAWFDDFTVTIDEEDLQTKEEYEEEPYPAELDSAFDQGSKVVFPELTPGKITDLELLGRIWGFLKYHHPTIAQGQYNWDYELFRFLPDYLGARKRKARDKLLIEWITALGELTPCAKCATSEDAFLKPDLAWIDPLESDLKEKLMQVYQSRSQGEHFYIKMAPFIGNPDFRNENAYASMTYPDRGFRLLGVYRYWNMIQYFFPYRHLTDKDWNDVLGEYIPLFLNAEDELAYEMAALGLIGEIRDTHANIWRGADKVDEWKGSNYPPLHVRFIEDQLVVTDYYNPELKEEAGLEIGTVITHINDRPVNDIVTDSKEYYPASNQPTRLRDISHDILRSNEGEVDIRYTSAAGDTLAKKLPLYPKDSLNTYRWYPRKEMPSFKMLDDSIGYITLQTIKDEDLPKIKKEFLNTRGIIIDIRNYPSTFVPFSLGSYFESSSAPFVKFTSGSVNNPGEFTFAEPLTISSMGETYQGKLVVLVNELSQSQAEYTSMAFRATDNATIIGSTTAGADGNVSPFYLPGGLRTMISGIGVYYPDGGETQRVGIVPDVEVKPTVAGIREGRDELMEAAIELILKE